MDIAAWLRNLGLEQYEPAFRDNAIEADTLPALTDEDLRELGVAAIGHRKKLLAAIRALSPAEPPGPAREPVGERRPLIVMFTDLVGSTEMASREDPEEWHDILVEYHRAVAAAVARFGGYVAKNLGDGALIYFGFPQAEENDAERAARAGLAILDAIAVQNGDLAERGRPRLAARIGIHAGPVVLGADTEIYGDVPNIAARVQAEAEPGTVLVTGAVHRLISGRFVVSDRGAAALKGIAEKMPLYRVLTAIGSGRWRAEGRIVTPLIGRMDELTSLAESWALARTGQGRLVLITAEAGLGKSRLIEEFQAGLSNLPHLWIELTCAQLSRNTPLKPFIDFVRSRLEEQAPTPSARAELLCAWHRLVGLDPHHSVPLVVPLLDLPLPPGYAPAAAPSEEQGRSLIATLARWVLGGARAFGGGRMQAVVLVVEDVHWADPSTLEFLTALAEQGDSVPLLLLITARPEFTPPWPARPHHRTISLAPLDHPEIERMAAAVAAQGVGLSGETMAALVTRTGGVPLFIEEVTRLLMETGNDATHQIPLTLQASLIARLDRLGSAKEVAQIGAVLGRDFDYVLIRAVAALDEAALADGLKRLTDAGIIEAQGRPPNSHYRFKHALIQDAAYGTLLRHPRQLLHARIVAALEAQFPHSAAAQPALLARHCTEAGLTDKALANWLRAGQQAIARSAMTEATAQLRHGLDLLAALPDDTRRREQELELQMALLFVLRETKGYSAPDVGRTLSRARELNEQLNRREFLFQLYLGEWVFHTVRAEHDLSQGLAEEMLKIGKARDNFGIEQTGRRLIGQTRLYRGAFLEARALLGECLAALERAPIAESAQIGALPGELAPLTLYALAPANLAQALANLGDLAQAQARLEQGLAQARRIGLPFLRAEVLGVAGWVDALTGAHTLGARADELLALATDHGFTAYITVATAHRGWALTSGGDPEGGRAEIIECLAKARKFGAVSTTPLGLTWLARSEAALGRHAAGLDCLAQAFVIIERTGERINEAEVLWVEGDLRAALDNAEAAETSYRRALDLARRQGARLLELLAATAFARFLADRNRRQAALDLLRPLIDGFPADAEAPVIAAARHLSVDLT